MRSLGQVIWRSGALAVLWGVLLASAVIALDRPVARLAAVHPERARLANEGAVLVALALASWAMARLVERRPFSSLGFTRERAGRAVAAGVVLGGGQLALAVGALAVTGYARFGPAGAPPWGRIAVAAAAVVLNTVAQELLFRGYLFQVARRELGARAAVIGTSALFTLAHLSALQGSWLAAVNVFLAGTAYGLARAATDGLWLSTSMHAAWSVLVGPILGVAVGGSELGAAGWRLVELRGPGLATGGAFGVEGSVATLLATVPLVAALWRAYLDVAPARPSGRVAANTGR